MCRTLGVSRAGFYDWESRPRCQRDLEDDRLAIEIVAIWECSARSYGRRGCTAGCTVKASTRPASGWRGSCATTAGRGCRAAAGCTPRSWTARPPPPPIWWPATSTPPPRRHLGRRHHLHRHRGGLAVPVHGDRPVLEAGDRLGGRRQLRTPLVSAALEMAVATHGGHVDGVVFHSDRGCQPGFTSAEYRQLCERLG